MENKLKQLKVLLGEAADINLASSLLSWEQQTYMPAGGAEARGYMNATLDSLAHQKFTSKRIGRLLEALEPYAAGLEPDSDDACLVRVTKRQYDKLTRVPSKLVAEYSQATTMAIAAWQKARAENDFEQFRPHLEKVFDLRRRYAEVFAPYDHIYDALLDDFEPGMKTQQVREIFGKVRPQQVALIKAIAGRPQVDDDFLHQEFDLQKQWDFGLEVATRVGYDWEHGRLDKSPHPFTQNVGYGDVRITTRLRPDFFNTHLFGTLHEVGHALYELGLAPELARSPLADGASLGVHESQSRMWENLVGRSLPFWEFYYPRLQAYFPEQLGGVSLEAFYKGINRVSPSAIRVEADEATYNLHIMLRLEIEIGVIEGSLAVKDLPEIWNTRMEEYLGVRPVNDAQGVMQDIHWSMGLIGYFPTYALGNLISAQLWRVIQQDVPDLDEQMRRGEFGALLGWLREKIHRHGAKYKPTELVQRTTGGGIDPQPYIEYIRSKYAAIYGL